MNIVFINFTDWNDVMNLIEPELHEEGPQDLAPSKVNEPSPIQRSKAGIGTGNSGIREEETEQVETETEVDDKSKSFEILR